MLWTPALLVSLVISSGGGRTAAPTNDALGTLPPANTPEVLRPTMLHLGTTSSR